MDLVHCDPSQGLLSGQDHLLDPLLLLLGSISLVRANGDPHDEQDGQPGDHGVEQHQRHTECHPGGVTQGVTRAEVIIEGAQHNQIGRRSCYDT